MSALRGIHAASGPATVSGRGPVELVGMHGFQRSNQQTSGAVPSPLAGPCGGMECRHRAPGTGSRRVPRAVRAPRPRPTQRLIRTSDAFDLDFRRHPMVGMHGFQRSNQQTFWCGALAACGTVWRHGCRHRAPRDGFTACPASGEGTAPSTHSAFDLDLRRLTWTSDGIHHNSADNTTALTPHALSRYPLRKIAATTPRHTSRNRKVMPVLTAMCTSALP